MAKLHEIKTQLPELAPFTKKDLQDLYELSPNTIYKTIASCGLSTAAEQYSLQEISENFHDARLMIAAGRNYKQVAAHFSSGNHVQPEEPNATGHTEATAQEGASASKMAAFQVVNRMARSDAQQAVQAYLPLFQLHLGKEFQSPAFQQNLQSTIELFTPVEEADHFLLQGLDSLGLLPPEMSQQALLAASNEESSSDIETVYTEEFAA
ncbi:MAG: hypothetical protein MUC48_24675 [Leptolyngbya sp. Prado105]|nr:hypothetical protein [Leptolyngbya sp. Prado105]